MSSYSLTLFITFYFLFVSNAENNSRLMEYNEDETNKKEDDWEEFFKNCYNINLNVSAYTDSEKSEIIVRFNVPNATFKDCCTYYDISLQKDRRNVEEVKVKYLYSESKMATYKFQNVSCGIYEIVIRPCYDDVQCFPKDIRYPKLLNVSSNECSLNIEPLSRKLILKESIDRNIIITVAVLSVISVLFVIGLVYKYFSSVRNRHQNRENESSRNGHLENEHDNPAVDGAVDEGMETINKKICLFIFHFYDQLGEVKNQVRILRDFLSQFSYFSAIKVIDDDLAKIHPNPKEWLNRTLDREAEDGSIIKFIIIDFEEEFEEEGKYKFENVIFREIVETIDNDRSRSLLGYDSLFIVRLNGIEQYSRRLAEFVRRHRYHIPNPHHLVDLCVNLCSGTGINECEVEKRVRELVGKDPIQNLGLVQQL